MSRHAAAPAVTIEFLTSNLSMPRATMLAGSPESYVQHLEEIGADGIELTPVPSRFVRSLVHASGKYPAFASFDSEAALPEPVNEQDEMMGQIIRSGHSSFRRDGEKAGLLARPFYTVTQSLGILAQAQVLTSDLPVVVCGHDKGDTVYDDRNAPFASRTVQPKLSEFVSWGLQEDSSIADIEAAMAKHGVTGFTFDVFNAQVGEGKDAPFRSPVALAQRLAAAGLVEALHLSVDRFDITGMKPTKLARATRQAGTAFATSALAASKTPEGEMMSVIADEWAGNPVNHGDKAPFRVVYEEGPLTQHNAYKQARILSHAREIMDR